MTPPTAEGPPGDHDTCDNCGRAEDELVVVRRVYLGIQPHDDRTDPPVDIVDELERWCQSCCATYPHVES